MQQISEVAPALYRIRQTMGRKGSLFTVNVFVIAGEEGLVFDGGYGQKKEQDRLVEHIQSIEKSDNQWKIQKCLASHSHWDHFSGFDYLQKTLGFEILATLKQTRMISSKQNYRRSIWADSLLLKSNQSIYFEAFKRLRKRITREFFMAMTHVRFVSGPLSIIDENTSFTINGNTWQMIPVPGHCNDHIVLYDEQNGILLGGDLVLKKITTWLGPPRSNLADYIESLERIKALPHLRIIFPAHGGAIQDPISRIQAAIDHRKKRTNTVIERVAETGNQGISFERLFQTFYPEKASYLKNKLASGWIAVTLEHLVENNQITIVKNGKQVLFKHI